MYDIKVLKFCVETVEKEAPLNKVEKQPIVLELCTILYRNKKLIVCSLCVAQCSSHPFQHEVQHEDGHNSQQIPPSNCFYFYYFYCSYFACCIVLLHCVFILLHCLFGRLVEMKMTSRERVLK